jgi:heat-inducible transcriptional repressor
VKLDRNEERLLDERESAVLRTIVHDYILTGKPVGSRSFVQKYSFSLSPATMRNIMYDLERLDYLTQPHTSAGRIPTDKGYRFYVDSLLEKYDFHLNETIKVKEEYLNRELQLEKIFSSVTRTLSVNSKYASVMLTPRLDFTVLKRIELIPLDENDVLVVLITRTGMIINKKVSLSTAVTQDDLHRFSRYLTAELCGFSLLEIKDSILDRLRLEKLVDINVDLAIDIAQLGLGDFGNPILHLDGIENLLKIPEMVEEERLHSLLNIIEEKDILRTILEEMEKSDGVRTLIGDEIPEVRVTGCSMVTSAYKIGTTNVGVLGVLGPTRMEYEKVVPLVDYTGKIVSDLLTKMSK